jgi:hypothetical protein
MRGLKLGAAAAVAAVAISVALGALGSRATTSASAALSAGPAVAKPFTAKVAYRNTGEGHQQGDETVDIDGSGRFSAKLGPGAKLGAAIVALATGVPLTEIAKGGTYKEQQSAGNRGETGTVVANFFERSLGTVCVSYSAKTGKYNPSKSYLPVSGRLTVIGGTGGAATWRGGLMFSQGAVTGSSLEQLLYGGALQVSTGTARPLTAACKRVAALAG